MRTCPECGRWNDVGTPYCPNCAHKLMGYAPDLDEIEDEQRRLAQQEENERRNAARRNNP